MSAARPLVSVFKAAGDKEQVTMPAVFTAPIRPDVVQFVHTGMNKNKRQAYAVKDMAGHGHSAHSWGTGRAVSRIPRVSGGGTSRAGQAAFGNMCRKGRMFAPTKTWRKWHSKINQNQKRYAVASALAASALPSLVMARGHRIGEVTEIPLVIEDGVEGITKTKSAVAALKDCGAFDDAEKAANSKKMRAGKGKLRGRRHTMRRGPLVVYANDNGLVKAFRNLPGVETASVDSLSLLQLAPGGHLGRFIVWTKGAFQKLNEIYGSTRRESTTKSGYKLPHNIMANTDVARLINSDEIQAVVRPTKNIITRKRLKKNPLKNLGVRVRLNPYALSLHRSEMAAEARRKEGKKALIKKARSQKGSVKTANFNRLAAN
jgi:large subunit ribosomal protein L4e